MSDIDPNAPQQAYREQVEPTSRTGTPAPGIDPASRQAALDAHRKAFGQYSTQAEQVQAQMQANTDRMTKMIDDTTAALKANREGRINMPLVAMGAAMMSTPGPPGVSIGAGLKAMLPHVQAQRTDEDNYQMQIANLALKRAGLEEAPLKERLNYLRAMQTGELGAERALEFEGVKGEFGLERERLQAEARMTTKPKDELKIVQDAIKDVTTAARQQYDTLFKDTDRDPATGAGEMKRLIVEGLKARQTAGLPISDAQIEEIANRSASEVSQPAGQPATGPSKIVQAAIEKARADALKVYEASMKDSYRDPAETMAEVRRIMIANLKNQQAAGVRITDEQIQQIADQTAESFPKPAPSDRPSISRPVEQANQAGYDKGLPPVPANYPYKGLPPKQQQAVAKEEDDSYDKLTKDWAADSDKYQMLKDRHNRLLEMARKRPDLFGVTQGLPYTNWSGDAKAIQEDLEYIKFRDFPKGQGAISDGERELMTKATPSTGMDAATFQRQIALRQRILDRSHEYQTFVRQYFDEYRTIKGADTMWERYVRGPGAFVDNTGKPIPDDRRMSWQDFMKRQHARPQGYARGGLVRRIVIHLGEEWGRG